MASTVGHVLPVAMDVHMHVDLRAAAALPRRPKPPQTLLRYRSPGATLLAQAGYSSSTYLAARPLRSFLLPGRPTGAPSLSS